MTPPLVRLLSVLVSLLLLQGGVAAQRQCGSDHERVGFHASLRTLQHRYALAEFPI